MFHNIAYNNITLLAVELPCNGSLAVSASIGGRVLRRNAWCQPQVTSLAAHNRSSQLALVALVPLGFRQFVHLRVASVMASNCGALLRALPDRLAFAKFKQTTTSAQTIAFDEANRGFWFHLFLISFISSHSYCAFTGSSFFFVGVFFSSLAGCLWTKQPPSEQCGNNYNCFVLLSF